MRNSDVQTPWVLVLYDDCMLFGGALPYDGGVVDQDRWLLDAMKACRNATTLSRRIDIKNPEHRSFYRWLFPKD